MAGLIFRAKFVIFLSTLSLRRATSAPAIKSCWSSYFYPRSPCGERPKSANTLPAVTLFLSTLSLRRATYTAICLAPPILFLSTLSLRRATGRGPHSPLVWQISIHALLAESDNQVAGVFRTGNPFLSTLSLRRATLCSLLFFILKIYFYPRSPCGERRLVGVGGMNNHVISIHALLAESDTPPYNLMIHHKNFYPRSPCGERLEQSSSYNAYLEEFLSTLSLRRATRCGLQLVALCKNFYPRSPCGERRFLIFYLVLKI